jgi:hypothetical protein
MCEISENPIKVAKKVQTKPVALFLGNCSSLTPRPARALLDAPVGGVKAFGYKVRRNATEVLVSELLEQHFGTQGTTSILTFPDIRCVLAWPCVE